MLDKKIQSNHKISVTHMQLFDDPESESAEMVSVNCTSFHCYYCDFCEWSVMILLLISLDVNLARVAADDVVGRCVQGYIIVCRFLQQLFAMSKRD